MPHLVLLYTPNLDALLPIARLCRELADTLLAQCDEAGQAVFPPGGVRVFAVVAQHSAVADGGAAGRAAGGDGDYGFVYLNLRMGAGRSAAVQQACGDALLQCASAHVRPVLAEHHIGLTVQVDTAPGQVYDGKLSNLHPLFSPPGLA